MFSARHTLGDIYYPSHRYSDSKCVHSSVGESMQWWLLSWEGEIMLIIFSSFPRPIQYSYIHHDTSWTESSLRVSFSDIMSTMPWLIPVHPSSQYHQFEQCFAPYKYSCSESAKLQLEAVDQASRWLCEDGAVGGLDLNYNIKQNDLN